MGVPKADAMARNEAYYEAEKRIEEAQVSVARELDLGDIPLSELPEQLSKLKYIESLNLGRTKLTSLPNFISELVQLREVYLYDNQFEQFPEPLRSLTKLNELSLSQCHLKEIPEWIGELSFIRELTLYGNNLSELPIQIGKLSYLQVLNCSGNRLTNLPISVAQLNNLRELKLDNNPLTPELAAAYGHGLEAVKTYLRAKSVAQITLSEAKLILIGEGEVGKTCLLGALRGDNWVEGLPTTHGIQIKQIKIAVPESDSTSADTAPKTAEKQPNFLNKTFGTLFRLTPSPSHPDTQTEITLNGWDFGGQRVYRPTHQLFFSAPAVYLVVWKPREGPQQGFVKEWVKLVKHREPDAKILVVATHGGPQQRQPDIDRQELWDLFGRETVADFFFVDSKPDANGNRKGIEELKLAIVRLAAELPEVGRSVPKSFADVRAALQAKCLPYLPLDEVLAICRAHKMDDEIARLFLTISHRLGHLTHYQHDPALRDIVILRPDWLATAMSYVLDDKETRNAHGLVKFSRLNHLWDDPTRGADSRYARTLHPIFLRLMERFDLSYRVADSSPKGDSDPQSLIAQLVPDNRPDNFVTSWLETPSAGDLQQTQICRIVDDKGNTATAEGLFYQLIVRLHKYSLGRAHYADSVHWQRGLVLDDDYNGRALLEHKGNDVHITVRAAFPERFLAMLTAEVKYLVESFWEGLRCDVMVPCINPCGKNEAGTGMFEVEKLIAFRKQGMTAFPCMVSGCNTAQDIGMLLRNAPVATAVASDAWFAEVAEVKDEVAKVRQQVMYVGEKTMERFDRLDNRTRRILSQADKNFDDFIHLFTDEAKEGPRLFSLFPLDRSKFNPKEWIREKFRLVLWCEHSRLPLPVLNDGNMKKGVYDLDLDREWFKKASPYLKFLSGTLGMVLPVASSAVKLKLDETAYKLIEEQLDFGKSIIDATLSEATKLGEFMGAADTSTLEHGVAIRSDGATLRELHALLKAVDKTEKFGGLVRVMNKRQEFMWVHERFAGEY